MAPDDDLTSTDEIEARLQQVGRYSKSVEMGLGVILGAFALAVGAVLPANLGSVSSVVDAILLRLIFVGLGPLLFGIGMHLHLVHPNLVRQLRQNPDSDSGSAGDEREP